MTQDSKAMHGLVPREAFIPIDRSRRSGSSALSRPSLSYWQDAWIRLRRNKVAVASAAYILALVCAAIILPSFLPFGFADQEIWNKHAPPNFGMKAVVVDVANLDTSPILVQTTEIPTTTPEGEAAATEPGFAPESEGSLDGGGLDGEGSLDGTAPSTVDGTTLLSPGALQIVGTPVTQMIKIQWQPVTGATGYRVFRSAHDDSLGLPIADIPAEQVSFADVTSLTPEKYYYYVAATDSMGGEGPPSEPLRVEPQLSLDISDAQKIDPNAAVGQVITTKAHPLGTDYLGRDLLARVLEGARVSLLVGFLAPLIYVFIGVIYGCISGYFGGLIDDIMMRIADIVFTVPDLLVVIMLQVTLGSNMATLILALVVTTWARSARQIRGQALQLRETEFVHAAKVLGTPVHRIIIRHVVPNTMGTVLVLFTLSIPQAIFTEAFLSFIGLGIAPPQPSWGSVVRDGAQVFLTYPHELLIPASIMCLTMLAFNLLGDGLRDALDPKLRGTGS